MKISIITTTFNSKNHISNCLESVYNQSYRNIDQIIVDGNSSDGTIKAINSAKNRVVKIISEPDKGIYDAMNKGINLATGDIIGILNSDDYYASDTIVEEVLNHFLITGCDAVYGNIDFVSTKDINRVIRHWKSSKYMLGGFMKGWHPPHPTFFVKRDIYEKYGVFDTTLNVSADFELMLRFIEKHKIHVEYLDKTIVKMRYGGESTGSLKKIIEGNVNIMRAFKMNNIMVSKFYPIIRLVPKLKQFFKK